MAKRGTTDLSLMVAVDKPSGMTSHDVVNRVRRIFGERRVGHTGTLDPLASGVLPVCIGPATRLDNYLVGHAKSYVVSVIFGAATDTDDAEGEVIRTGDVPEEVFDPFFATTFVAGLVGKSKQLPPVYSAIKVAGTKAGITAIQMDLKNDGLTHEIIKEALDITRDARFAILDEVMLPCIAAPRPEVCKWAPKMLSMKIDPDKIREVIGKGGSVIQKITAESGAQIDIEDDGTIHIASPDAASCDAAKKMIETIVFVPQVGELYYGKVVRILQFGAFVELAPGKDGMVHISKLAERRVEKVEDVVNIGDMIWVKVTEIDEKGRVNLSYKDALREIKAKKEAGLPIK